MSSGGGDGRCPSTAYTDDAELLGVVGPTGRVAFVGAATRLTDDARRHVDTLERPERQLRFTAPCQTTGCGWWRDGGCRVGRMAAAAAPAVPAELPECGIRDTCQWFRQEGAAACAICDRVVTDARRTDGPRPIVRRRSASAR